MYGEKMEDILLDLENGEICIAGGSVVGMVLSIVNSLVTYISNLTLRKKKYEDIKPQVEEILKEAQELKVKAIKIIDQDKITLEEILKAYKKRKNDEETYQRVLKNAVEFCMDVLKSSFDTYKLVERISNVGNEMLESDFRICKHYAIASVKSAIENVRINLIGINDIEYKNIIKKKCNRGLQELDLS